MTEQAREMGHRAGDRDAGWDALREVPRSAGADARWLFAPIPSLTGRMRWLLIVAWSVATLGWSALWNGDLGIAWGLPDVAFYMAMAHGHIESVPQPFSARPLAPLLALGVAALGPWRAETGFTVVAVASLLTTLGVVFWLMMRSGAPRWMLLAVAAVPFWPQLLRHAGLPDPLYAALLALLLVALEREWMPAAAALMLPLMVARESTSLTLLCLLAVGWRRLRWSGAGLAVGCTLVGAWVVRRLSVGGLPNPEHLSGTGYLVGKILANSVRSVGLRPWSNVYPLCRTPAVQIPLHAGPVQSVGICSWSPVPPTQIVWVLLTSFGVLPWFLWVSRRVWREAGAQGLLFRFCVLYGSVSLLLAPALGTWYSRLFAYGWPLLLVAVPRLVQAAPGAVAASRDGRLRREVEGSLLLLHLLVCAVSFGVEGPVWMGWAAGLQALAGALVLVQRRRARTRFAKA